MAMEEQFPFGECMPHLKAGGEIDRVLPSGKTRTLKIIKAGECDCNFPDTGEMFVTVNDNDYDQKYGVWCDMQADVLATNWRKREIKK